MEVCYHTRRPTQIFEAIGTTPRIAQKLTAPNLFTRKYRKITFSLKARSGVVQNVARNKSHRNNQIPFAVFHTKVHTKNVQYDCVNFFSGLYYLINYYGFLSHQSINYQKHSARWFFHVCFDLLPIIKGWNFSRSYIFVAHFIDS